MVSIDTLKGKRGLQVMYLNTRSLKSKYPRLQAELVGAKFDVMCYVESWLTDNIYSDDVKFDGYELHRVDRTWIDPDNVLGEDGEPKTGGGVCVYVNECIKHDAYDLQHLNQSTQNIEIQCIRIDKPNNKRIVLLNTYRPPNGCKIAFIQQLKDTLTAIPERRKVEIIITGDINIDLAKQNDRVKDFKKVLKDFGLHNLIKEYTRCTGKSKTKIDVICTNAKFVNEFGTLNLNISDHLALYMIRKKSVSKRPKIEIKGRSYKNYKHEKLKQDIDGFDWQAFDQTDDPSIKWDIFHNLLEDHLNTSCPIKTFKVPEAQQEWISDHLRNSLRDKNNLLAKARRTDKNL